MDLVSVYKNVVWELARQISTIYNPVVSGKLADSLRIYFPLSHRNGYKLIYRKDLANDYSEILRLAGYVLSTNKQLSMMDIGANIGEASLVCYEKFKTGIYHVIEGNQKFFPVLTKNVNQIPHGLCENIFLGDKNEKIRMKVNHYTDTGNISMDPKGQMLTLYTLDAICEKHAVTPNFLKIDTDGYDSKILKGASRLLKKSNKMVVYFEYSPIHQILYKTERVPSNIFQFLFKHGYHDFYFYDTTGLLFAHFQIDDLHIIKQFTEYALAKITHFNVLTFHHSNNAFRKIFESGEKQILSSLSEQNWSHGLRE